MLKLSCVLLRIMSLRFKSLILIGLKLKLTYSGEVWYFSHYFLYKLRQLCPNINLNLQITLLLQISTFLSDIICFLFFSYDSIINFISSMHNLSQNLFQFSNNSFIFLALIDNLSFFNCASFISLSCCAANSRKSPSCFKLPSCYMSLTYDDFKLNLEINFKFSSILVSMSIKLGYGT